MKYILNSSFIFSIIVLLAACQSSEERNSMDYLSKQEIRKNEVVLQGPKALVNPGKIYIKEDFLLVNEMGKGIHLIYNQNPAAPKKIGFVSIAGNIDVAMKGDILYADNYMDLLAINTTTGTIKRVRNAFKNFEKERRAQLLALNNGFESMGMRGTQFQAVSHGTPTSGGNPVGVAGSMARFAIVGNTLYVLDGNTLIVYDVTDASNPIEIKEMPLEFTVETIFPHEGQLFIGGTEGMYIYDKTDPHNPQFLSKFEHAVACDPVVVHENYAYVTLRSGGPCDRAINQLEVVDISDLHNPQLVQAVNMHHPHGLSVMDNTLYLCDGNQGFKVFDVRDKHKILDHLKFKDRDVRKAYDVLPNVENNTLIVVGADGIYQYDAIDPNNIERISKIAREV
jgi:hypothetical protein